MERREGKEEGTLGEDVGSDYEKGTRCVVEGGIHRGREEEQQDFDVQKT